VAAIAVKRAASRATDLISLYEELSTHVENKKERDEFLGRAPRSTAATSCRIPILHADDGAADPIMRQSQPLVPPDPAVLDDIEAKLAEHLGPIARILIARRLQNFQGLSELCRSLAGRISDESERAAFLNLGGGG
jgi:serine/threonine-protein kinase